MCQYLLSCLLFVLFATAALAQLPTLSYQQDQFAGWQISSTEDLQLTYPAPTAKKIESISVIWQVGGQQLLLSTPVSPSKARPTIGTAIFSMPLLDASLEGHLEWGKAALEELDSQALDSMITIPTQINIPEDTIIGGSLAISFQGGWDAADEFWNRAAQYKLIHQQRWVQDSVKEYTQQVRRSEALLALSEKSLAKALATIASSRKTLSTLCPNDTIVDRLLLVEKEMSQALAAFKKGKAMTDAEKMNLADQTTKRSQLLAAFNQQQDATCQQTLQLLMEQQRTLAYLQQQRELLLQTLQKKQQYLQRFEHLQTQTTKELAFISARLNN